MTRTTKGLALFLALLAAAPACGSDEGPLGDVQALVILQRPARNEVGDIFQYESYMPGARLIQLSPPTADGTRTVICCDHDPAFAEADISGYDLSFDADIVDGVPRGQVVFSAKRTGSEPYGLFIMDLQSKVINQLPTDPQRHYVSPAFLAGGKIAFTTTSVVEPGAAQHVDEYNRGTTMQLGTITMDGTETLGPRNLSHRVYPSALSSGRIMFTQWDHLGEQNAGHLMQTNADMTQMREVYGKENTGVANSYLKAVEVSPGRVLTIATAREMTIQAGAILDVRLGNTYEEDGNVLADREMSEANATYRLLTPNVPLGEDPSRNQVGRYYDAYPLNARDYPDLLVSWADGPVESGTLGAAGLSADFGVYLYNSKNQTREPILNDIDTWDVFPRPLRPRPAPAILQDSQPDQYAGTGALVGSMNVYDSTIFSFEAGSIYGVRIMEGFSSEEGFPEMFGFTENEGHALIGTAPLADDNSWAAVVPANIPIHVQAIDRFGMSRGNEPVWTSGRPGEARVCGGCHESRTASTQVQPGLLHAVVQGPLDAMSTVPRNQRLSNTFTQAAVVGVPWDGAIQPLFDSSGCVTCHDGTPGPANPSFTIVDNATGAMTTFTFSLRGTAMNLTIGDFVVQGFSESYVSMVGFDMEQVEEADVTIIYPPGWTRPLEPFNYYGSRAAQILNPVQQFPTVDATRRAFGAGSHYADLSPVGHYLLTLAADMGANWYSRENNPDVTAYQ